MTTYTYDALNRRKLTQQAKGPRDGTVFTGQDYQRDGVGNPINAREATGRRTTWTYDAANQLINEHRSAASGGFNTTHVYDPVGNRLVKDEAGAVTTSTFDAANQTMVAVSPSGTTTYTFDAAGNQQIEQAPGGTTTNVRDYENMRTAVLLPNGTRQTMSYNAELRQNLREV